MRSNRTRNIVIIAIWLFIGSIAGYFLYNGVVNGGFSFETKHVGEPTIVLNDVTLDESIKSVSINWISGGVKILPTTGNSIRIVEKAYEPVDKSKWVNISVSGTALSVKTNNKPLFYFLGLMTRSTYLEVYLPITTSFDSVKLNGVSGSYSMDDVYADLTQITLTSGKLTIDNSYCGLLSLTMTSGSSTITHSQILSTNIDMTSGNLDYQADTIHFKAEMTSGLANIDFGITNPDSMILSMTSGSSNIHLYGQDAFNVSVDKTSGIFNPNFAHVKNEKIYSYLTGGPTYVIKMTSGLVNLTLSPQ